MIRSKIKKHQDITGLLPGKVIDYIRQNELYRCEMDLKDIKKKVKKSMDKQRYDHTKGVMYTAGALQWQMSIL